MEQKICNFQTQFWINRFMLILIHILRLQIRKKQIFLASSAVLLGNLWFLRTSIWLLVQKEISSLYCFVQQGHRFRMKLMGRFILDIKIIQSMIYYIRFMLFRLNYRISNCPAAFWENMGLKSTSNMFLMIRRNKAS